MQPAPPKRLLCLSILAISAIFASSANADIVHQPRFKIDAMIIVWSGPAETLATARLNAKSGTSVSLQPTAPVISTNLIPLEARQGDTAPVPLRDSLIGTTDLYVASNTGFSIDAELTDTANLTAEALETVKFAMSAHLDSPASSVTGRKAQYAHSGGPDAGFVSGLNTLADLTRRSTVFRGNQRTARERGSIAEQSVRFQVAYSAPSGRAVSTLPDVTFTVFVP